ncbi:MAG: transcription termination/antitermination protein NusA [Thermotoga sp.]|nr:MAG: transcription termination/antitermination protein NusA [Thermotoga sp.]
MNINLLEALEQLEEEKNISKEEVFKILEKALLSAYRKNFGRTGNVEIVINRMTGEIEVYQILEVVEKVEDPATQIDLEEAQKIDFKAKIGDKVKKKLNVKKFGRIAAQTAKQVLIQKIREIEKDNLYKQYLNMVRTVVTAEVIRVSQNFADIRVGKLETRLLRKEMIPSEELKVGDFIKVYITDIKRKGKGPVIMVSRRVPELILGLLKLEIPEVDDGTVEVVKIAREAGVRSKVAVKSNNPLVDPVGACIGEGGARINSIMKELKGERIDVIKWADDPREFIANALSPASVVDVQILNEEEKSSRVYVSPTQLSLAIGKGGQNVRLAVKLTGWKIDVKPLMK